MMKTELNKLSWACSPRKAADPRVDLAGLGPLDGRAQRAEVLDRDGRLLQIFKGAKWNEMWAVKRPRVFLGGR